MVRDGDIIYILIMKVEGLVFQKTPYKERDMIVHLLTRKGQKTSLYVYGGQGGGKSKKGSLLELGHMLSFVLQKSKGIYNNSDQKPLSIAKVDQVNWAPKYIRNDYRAFMLSQFFLEVIQKLALSETDDIDFNEHEGIFNVLSNALYYLDKAVEGQNVDYMTHLLLFFTKLIHHLGIAPNYEECQFCQKILGEDELCLLDISNGGFSCLECTSKMDEYLSDNRQLSEEYQAGRRYKQAFQKFSLEPYKNYLNFPSTSVGLVRISFNFLNYQFGFAEGDYRTWKLLFE